MMINIVSDFMKQLGMAAMWYFPAPYFCDWPWLTCGGECYTTESAEQPRVDWLNAILPPGHPDHMAPRVSFSAAEMEYLKALSKTLTEDKRLSTRGWSGWRTSHSQCMLERLGKGNL